MTKKRRRRHTPEQIVRKLRDADAMLNAGKDFASVLQFLEVSEATYQRWRNQYGGMKAEEAKRLKELEEEKEIGFSSALKYLKSVSAKLPLSTWFSSNESSETFVEILEATLAVMQRELTEARFRQDAPDMIVAPDLAGVGILDFHRGETVIEIGRAAAQKVLPQLQALRS